MYKRLQFSIVGPIDSKPVLFDDTCYFFACETEEEAEILFAMLDSEPAREFFASLIFWDAKRPITAKILNALDLSALQDELKLSGDVVDRLVVRQHAKFQLDEKQKLLFT